MITINQEKPHGCHFNEQSFSIVSPQTLSWKKAFPVPGKHSIMLDRSCLDAIVGIWTRTTSARTCFVDKGPDLMTCLLPSVWTWWELSSAQRAGKDPSVGPVRKRVGHSVLSDGWPLCPAAAWTPSPPGPKPQQSAGVSVSSLSGAASVICRITKKWFEGKFHRNVGFFFKFLL